MLNNLANIYFRQGDNERARPLWQRVLDTDPGNRFANTNLGVLHHYSNNYADAIRYFRRAMQDAPEDYRLWGRMGEAYALMPDHGSDAHRAFTRAAELAEEALRFNRSNWQLQGHLSLYYANLQQHKKANAALQAMFASNTADDPMKHYWAALVAYQHNDIETVFYELDRALATGFSEQIRFVRDEPVLQPLKAQHPQRFDELLRRY